MCQYYTIYFACPRGETPADGSVIRAYVRESSRCTCQNKYIRNARTLGFRFRADGRVPEWPAVLQAPPQEEYYTRCECPDCVHQEVIAGRLRGQRYTQEEKFAMLDSYNRSGYESGRHPFFYTGSNDGIDHCRLLERSPFLTDDRRVGRPFWTVYGPGDYPDEEGEGGEGGGEEPEDGGSGGQ